MKSVIDNGMAQVLDQLEYRPIHSPTTDPDVKSHPNHTGTYCDNSWPQNMCVTLGFTCTTFIN